MLLVADEVNDGIAVLEYKGGGGMELLRWLAPGCPLLVQPTALNVDVFQRLWVACRGGAVLMMEQASSETDDQATGA